MFQKPQPAGIGIIDFVIHTSLLLLNVAHRHLVKTSSTEKVQKCSQKLAYGKRRQKTLD